MTYIYCPCTCGEIVRAYDHGESVEVMACTSKRNDGIVSSNYDKPAAVLDAAKTLLHRLSIGGCVPYIVLDGSRGHRGSDWSDHHGRETKRTEGIMTQHNIGDRFTHGKYDIILGYDGYGLQEVATGNNPLWWDADNFIGGFDTLDQAITAVDMLDDADALTWAVEGDDLKQALFSLKGI